MLVTYFWNCHCLCSNEDLLLFIAHSTSRCRTSVL